MIKGYQLHYRGNYLNGKERLLVDDKVYLNLKEITEEGIEYFKSLITNGHGEYEVDPSTVHIDIILVHVI